jgi:hypothetical protein
MCALHGRTKGEFGILPCIVSYWDCEFKHSVEVTAETLYEAAVLAIKAMKAPKDRLQNLSFDVEVKPPHVWHSISGPMLSAWLAQPGKNQKEKALKVRLDEPLRS